MPGINGVVSEIDVKGPFNKLKSAMIRHLAATLPSISIRTGHSSRYNLNGSAESATSLAPAIDLMLSGSPLLCLDLRERLPVRNVNTREQLIEKAMEYYSKEKQKLMDDYAVAEVIWA